MGIQQLFPNSRELSMSSAKTIADILAFAELLDAKSFVGNPFTSQPVYIAACAFLMESTSHASISPGSEPSTTRSQSHLQPPKSMLSTLPDSDNIDEANNDWNTAEENNKMKNKHSLMRSAANQNYQRCYKALKLLETYWAGTKYILTALDQKATGCWDPLLYTIEEIECAVEPPSSAPAFTSPCWRRSIGPQSILPPMYKGHQLNRNPVPESKGSPKIDLSQGKPQLYMNPTSPLTLNTAIGFSLTGTTNSPTPNLSFLYETTSGESAIGTTTDPPKLPTTNAVMCNLSEPQRGASPSLLSSMPPPSSQPPTSGFLPLSTYPQYTTAAALTPYNIMPFGMTSSPGSNSSFAGGNSTLPPAAPQETNHQYYVDMISPTSRASSLTYGGPQHQASTSHPGFLPNPIANHDFYDGLQHPFGDITIQSQDIDMHELEGDMTPWLEYLPQDVLNLFDLHPGTIGY